MTPKDGVKTTLRTWTDITSTLRRVFQPPQPNWLLINEIGQDKQLENEMTDAYITRQMSRIARLVNFPINESQQIDLMYGHLRLKIKKGVPRSSIETIMELLEKARTIEQHEQEASTATPLKKTCSFCGNKGHVENECRKKKATTTKTSDETNFTKTPSKSNGQTPKSNGQMSNDNSNFSCYGCGAPNTVRSKCTTCKKAAKPLPEHKEFYSLHKEIGTELPMITANVHGYPASAFLDTCARASVASRELYFHLLNTDHPFEDVLVTIKLADGSQSTRTVMRTTTSIVLGNRTLPIQFIVIPDAASNNTLIGADFIKQTGIIPNLSQDAWCFADKLSEWFLFDYKQAKPNELTHINPNEQTNSTMPPPSSVKSSRNKRRRMVRLKQQATMMPSREYSTGSLPHAPTIAETPTSVRPPQEIMEENVSSLVSGDNEIDHQDNIIPVRDIFKIFSSPSFLPKMISPIGNTPPGKHHEGQRQIQYYNPDDGNMVIEQVKQMEREIQTLKDVLSMQYKPKCSLIPNPPHITSNEQRSDINQQIEILSIDFSLRDDEGQMLNATQSATIDELIHRHSALFRTSNRSCRTSHQNAKTMH